MAVLAFFCQRLGVVIHQESLEIIDSELPFLVGEAGADR